MNAPRRFDAYRDAPLYGWPFYAARKLMRRAGHTLLRAADALSLREKYAPSSLLGPLLPENAALRDRQRGRPGFVIGNGPSLATQDLAPLRGQVTFAMNAFLRHPLLAHVRPTYYLFADGVFFDGSAPCNQFLADVRAAVTHSTFLAPCAAAPTILARGLLPADRTHFVAYAGMLRSATLNRLDLTRPVPGVVNCAQLAIMLALYAGCSPIYLLGLDHDWLAHRGHEGHFYPGKTIANHPVAHGDKWAYGYRDQMRATMDAWDGYAALHAHATARGAQIINCTNGGFLDVFPRARYEDIVATPTRAAAVAA